ncbi:unnamed protein product [Amoebophrya sp. A25]|nr:unnamed protein product [Amoebophrya sp. A25]|eukprot:GSA25T00013489001.1
MNRMKDDRSRDPVDKLGREVTVTGYSTIAFRPPVVAACLGQAWWRRVLAALRLWAWYPRHGELELRREDLVDPAMRYATSQLGSTRTPRSEQENHTSDSQDHEDVLEVVAPVECPIGSLGLQFFLAAVSGDGDPAVRDFLHEREGFFATWQAIEQQERLDASAPAVANIHIGDGLDVKEELQAQHDRNVGTSAGSAVRIVYRKDSLVARLFKNYPEVAWSPLFEALQSSIVESFQENFRTSDSFDEHTLAANLMKDYFCRVVGARRRELHVVVVNSGGGPDQDNVEKLGTHCQHFIAPDLGESDETEDRARGSTRNVDALGRSTSTNKDLVLIRDKPLGPDLLADWMHVIGDGEALERESRQTRNPFNYCYSDENLEQVGVEGADATQKADPHSFKYQKWKKARPEGESHDEQQLPPQSLIPEGPAVDSGILPCEAQFFLHHAQEAGCPVIVESGVFQGSSTEYWCQYAERFFPPGVGRVISVDRQFLRARETFCTTRRQSSVRFIDDMIPDPEAKVDQQDEKVKKNLHLEDHNLDSGGHGGNPSPLTMLEGDAFELLPLILGQLTAKRLEFLNAEASSSSLSSGQAERRQAVSIWKELDFTEVSYFALSRRQSTTCTGNQSIAGAPVEGRVEVRDSTKPSICLFLDGPKGGVAVRWGEELLERFAAIAFIGYHDMHSEAKTADYYLHGDARNLARIRLEKSKHKTLFTEDGPGNHVVGIMFRETRSVNATMNNIKDSSTSTAPSAY